jgi:hypothetical protein
MSQRKTILLSVVSLVIGIVADSCATGWYAWRQKSREIQESVFQTKFIQTITLIRLCEKLETGEIENTRYGLEESLNANISYMAINAYQPSKSGLIARETIKMAAKHRTRFPFTANNPCINKMIAIAFQVIDWDGESAPPHQVYWSE